MSKPKMSKRERELLLLLAEVYENIPRAGEDRDGIFEKAGRLKNLCTRAFVPQAMYLWQTFQDTDRDIEQAIADLRRAQP